MFCHLFVESVYYSSLLSLAFCSFHPVVLSLYIFLLPYSLFCCPISPPPTPRRTWQIITGQSSAGELYLSQDKSLWHNWAKRLQPRQRAGVMRGGPESLCVRRKQLSFLLLFPAIGGVCVGCGVLQSGEGEPAGEGAAQPSQVWERGSARGWVSRDGTTINIKLFFTLYLIRHKTTFFKKILIISIIHSYLY